MEMLGEEDNKVRPSAGPRRPYLRSVSWSDRSPTKPNPLPRPPPNSKTRSFLPPLSIAKRPVEEWPKAGSDDLGVWPNPPQTPRCSNSTTPLESPRLEQPVREFEFKKDKLAFFDKECSRIADHIYLGSDAVAKNREVLKQNGITHVLNCVGFVCPEYFKGDFVYKTLWLQDSPAEDITSILYDVFDYFEDVREQNGRVFVHCCQGVSRSTSLVIAYLMWREGQSFEDAFQYVKLARGVANPNMGFACQLLQCQKRVHAIPASPNSVLRIYRMAPHSSYDPLHLVPKMLNNPGFGGFDSRGAFIVHVPSAIYVWIGKNCDPVMSHSARGAANQVVRYERAQGSIISIKEGEEPSEFWDAIAGGQIAADGGNDMVHPAIHTRVGERKVDEYDLDFELFRKATAGGVVPPFSVSNTGSETCLPARENGWGRLRQKFANGFMKELFTSSKFMDRTNKVIESCELDDVASLTNFSPASPPKINPFGSPYSSDCFPCSSPDGSGEKPREIENSVRLSDPFLSLTPPCGSPDSLSSYLGSSPQLSSKSPTLSPSTSDYASSFTFSPSSCNWSDLSYLSPQQTSPSGLETKDMLPHKRTPFLPTKIFSLDSNLGTANTCLPCKGTIPSIAERRGSNLPPCLLPSADEPSLVPRKLVKTLSFSLEDYEDDDDDDLMEDVDNQKKHGGEKDELMLDAEIIHSGNDSNRNEIKDKDAYGNHFFISK